MGKEVRFPKRYIVSCRINSDELLTLKKLARETGSNISDLLRNSLNQLTQEASEHRARA